MRITSTMISKIKEQVPLKAKGLPHSAAEDNYKVHL